MKIETIDRSPKPLTKKFIHVKPDEFFRWEGRKYFCEGCGHVLCIDDFKRSDWSYPEALDREVAMLEPPDWDAWRELTKIHFRTKMVEPVTMPVKDMKPGQVFYNQVSAVRGLFMRGLSRQYIRLSDGDVFFATDEDFGTPINGKFVEEDQTQ